MAREEEQVLERQQRLEPDHGIDVELVPLENEVVDLLAVEAGLGLHQDAVGGDACAQEGGLDHQVHEEGAFQLVERPEQALRADVRQLERILLSVLCAPWHRHVAP